jgi:putative NADH-flavin reductase
MKVLLIGATGATGVEILPRLLKAGHTVTALVRSPGNLKEKSDHLRVLDGDVRDQDLLVKATEGQDAVIAAFGPRSLEKSDLQETFMRNLVFGMQKNGVRRIVNLSAWGAGSTKPYMNLVPQLLRLTLLKNTFADKERGQKLLTDSALEYVNVCPGRLLNDVSRGGVKASVDGKGFKPEMTRVDLAQWMIDQLTSDTWVRKDPIVGY